MAITQQSIAEEILPRHERVIVRNVYRVSVLADTIKALDVSLNIVSNHSDGTKCPLTNDTINAMKNVRSFLVTSYSNALLNIKVPTTQLLAIEVLPLSK
jgi:hypothetical protein